MKLSVKLQRTQEFLVSKILRHLNSESNLEGFNNSTSALLVYKENYKISTQFTATDFTYTLD